MPQLRVEIRPAPIADERLLAIWTAAEDPQKPGTFFEREIGRILVPVAILTELRKLSSAIEAGTKLVIIWTEGGRDLERGPVDGILVKAIKVVRRFLS